MKIAALVAEYNPFHNGHAYHIEQTKAQCGADAVVAVMSGNFVQRGEAAIADKFLRAHAAVLGGCDLVIELPVSYALGSAKRFAYGAIDLISKMGCVNYVSFGSECGDIEKLKTLNSSLNTEEFSCAQKKFSDEGISYPLARSLAARELLSSEYADMLSEPNNILALEYINEIESRAPDLHPITIQRFGAFHDDNNTYGAFASASAIRASSELNMDISRFVPKHCYHLYKEAARKGVFYVNQNQFDTLVLSHLIRLTHDELSEVPDVSEGLENRIYDAIRSSQSLCELFDLVKSKRFTHSRIRRVIMCAYLGINNRDIKIPPQYIRVLSQNKTGSRVLREMKKCAKIPIITKPAHIKRYGEDAKAQFALEARATRLYSYALPDSEYRRTLNDYTRSACVIDDCEND